MKPSKSDWFALRSFRCGGKDLRAGDPFPWQELGVSERRLEQMTNQRRVGRAADLPKAAPSKEPTPVSAGRGPKAG